MPNQAQLIAIKGGGLIDVIREKPPLYIGERSLSALYFFLQGYVTGLRFYDIEAPYPLPADFHDWVAYRLHFFESTSGYRNMILKRVPNESAALDRFFELIDEHRVRKPHVVATARCDKEFTSTGTADRPENVRTARIPSPLNLVAYTDDPGFFVTSDDPDADFPSKNRFFPTLEMFRTGFGASKNDFTVLDVPVFDRWLSEQDRFASRKGNDKPAAEKT